MISVKDGLIKLKLLKMCYLKDCDGNTRGPVLSPSAVQGGSGAGDHGAVLWAQSAGVFAGAPRSIV